MFDISLNVISLSANFLGVSSLLTAKDYLFIGEENILIRIESNTDATVI